MTQPRPDQEYEITYTVRQRTNAPPHKHDGVFERTAHELDLQFGSSVTVEVAAVTPLLPPVEQLEMQYEEPTSIQGRSGVGVTCPDIRGRDVLMKR